MSVFECELQHRPQLQGTKEADVCILGAGMAGLNLAFLLSNSGKKVIVLEKNTIGSGQSCKTTAKMTCLPGFFYAELIERTGMRKAEQVARMMRKGLQTYADLIYHHQIDCDFERLPFMLMSKDEEKIEKEAKALNDLGFLCSVEKKKDTLLGCHHVLKLENQAQFNAGHWMSAISKGLEIYEHSTVLRVEQKEVFADKGKVKADAIVFCDHFPFVNAPGFYFMKMHQTRSHVLALRNVPRVNEMLYLADGPIETLRFVGQTALYGGFSHPTGQGDEAVLDKMKKKALERFPDAQIVDQWSAQDCITLDHLPYAGKFSSQRPSWYVSTGFNKWGMVYSMVSALILHDQICGVEHPDAEPFDSLRSMMNTPIEELKQLFTALKGYYDEFLTLPSLKIEDIEPGNGGVVEVDNMSLGVYKDTDGSIYTVCTRCPHLKCQLTWNGAEKTWDCPCHGSRFDCYGNRLDGPTETESILLYKQSSTAQNS